MYPIPAWAGQFQVSAFGQSKAGSEKLASLIRAMVCYGSHAEASETQGQPPLLCWGDQNKCLLSAFFLFVNRHSTFSKHRYLVFVRKSHLQCIKYYTILQDVACRQEGTGKKTAQKRLVYTTGLTIPHLSPIFSLLSIWCSPSPGTSLNSLPSSLSHTMKAFHLFTVSYDWKKNPTKYVGCQCWV